MVGWNDVGRFIWTWKRKCWFRSNWKEKMFFRCSVFSRMLNHLNFPTYFTTNNLSNFLYFSSKFTDKEIQDSHIFFWYVFNFLWIFIGLNSLREDFTKIGRTQLINENWIPPLINWGKIFVLLRTVEANTLIQSNLSIADTCDSWGKCPL